MRCMVTGRAVRLEFRQRLAFFHLGQFTRFYSALIPFRSLLSDVDEIIRHSPRLSAMGRTLRILAYAVGAQIVNDHATQNLRPALSMRLAFVAHRSVFVLACEFTRIPDGVHPGLPPLAEVGVEEIEALAEVSVRLRVVFVDDAAADNPLDAAVANFLALGGHIPLTDPEIELFVLGCGFAGRARGGLRPGS